MKFIQMDAYFTGQAAWAAQAGERLAELMSEEGRNARRVSIQQRTSLTADHRTLPRAEKGFLLLLILQKKKPLHFLLELRNLIG